MPIQVQTHQIFERFQSIFHHSSVCFRCNVVYVCKDVSFFIPIQWYKKETFPIRMRTKPDDVNIIWNRFKIYKTVLTVFQFFGNIFHSVFPAALVLFVCYTCTYTKYERQDKTKTDAKN